MPPRGTEDKRSEALRTAPSGPSRPGNDRSVRRARVPRRPCKPPVETGSGPALCLSLATSVATRTQLLEWTEAAKLRRWRIRYVRNMPLAPAPDLQTLQASGYQIQFVSHAKAILTVDFPDALQELTEILSQLTIPIEEIIGS